MFDPLAPANASPFAASSSDAPPWPTTPHSPELEGTFGKRAVVPVMPTSPRPPQSPHYDPNAREPQIYGQEPPGLISPTANTLSNGTRLERTDPYIRIRLTALDRNRRDILIRFDAQTNLPNFTGSSYRNVSRSYAEFQRFAEQIVYSNPQTIIPALPLPQTSAPTDEEDDRLVKVMLQRWLTRICEDPVVIHDEELRSFVESDFGYQPTIRPKRKTGSSFSILGRRGAPDEDEELLAARYELTRLETQFFEAAKAVDKLARARKALSVAHAEMGNKLVSVASTETHPQLASAMRKFGRVWHTIADGDLAHGTNESVILGDSLGYQGMNSKSAKETLLQRALALEEAQQAAKTTISKKRQIERLKASGNIRPEKVDEALEELEEAQQIENILGRRVNGISQNLHTAIVTHSKQAHDDITASLIEHARSSLIYERSVKRELEALRADVRAIGQPFTRAIVPQGPSVIPKLDEASLLPTRAAAGIVNGARQPAPLHAPLPVSVASSAFVSPITPASSQTLPIPSAPAVDPLGTVAVLPNPVVATIAEIPRPPLSPASVPLPVTPRPSTPVTSGSATAVNPSVRGIDGTQSMFIPPRVAQLNGAASGSMARPPSAPIPTSPIVASRLGPGPPSATSPYFDPLSQSAIIPGVGVSGRPSPAIADPNRAYSFDPLSGGGNVLVSPAGFYSGAVASQPHGPLEASSPQYQQSSGGLTFAEQQARAQAEAQARQAQLAARRQVEQRAAAQREAARKLANFL